MAHCFEEFSGKRKRSYANGPDDAGPLRNVAEPVSYTHLDSTVNVHVSNLRRKLKPTDTDGYLQTVWGMGYKLHNA